VSALQSRLAAALAARYAIEREIGRGGTAIVYLALDLKHGRQVALKVLRPDLAASVGAERFLREIRIAAGLTHPHILAVHDSGNADGLLYYVMPFVEGESLRDRLKREGPLPLGDSLRIAREVADALAYAHSQGVVHRDIKPGNILLIGGHAVVADFGIAVAAGGESEAFTDLGLVIGTPAYMSPEQGGAGGPLDGRTDLYSLGCVLYEMLTGEPPFIAPSPQAVMARHATDPIPPVRTQRPSVPIAVDAAVHRALAKMPADRFPTAQQFAEALAEVSSRTGRSDVTRSRRRRLAIAVGLVGLVAAAVVASLKSKPVEPGGPASLGVAVLPFGGDVQDAVEGQGSEAWVKLFEDAIEWLPRVRAIDGGAIASASPGWRSGDLAGVLGAARQHGARYLVVPAIRSRKPASSISAELYDVGRGDRILKAEAAAAPDSLSAAVDQVVRELLGAIIEREHLLADDRRWVLGATASARALGYLIQGQAAAEQGGFDEAAKAFAEAVAADSDCGLCYHRLSVVHEWRHDFDASMAAVVAGLGRGRRLRQYSAELLEAQRYYMMGQGDSAIVGFQEVVLDRPDASDAWLGLAESLFHYAGYAGHRATDSHAAFARLYALDSAIAPVTCYHMVDLAIVRGDGGEARMWVDRIPPENSLRATREVGFALRFGDTTTHRAALAKLKGGTRQAITQLVQIWLHGPIDAQLADTLAELLITRAGTPADRLRGAQYQLVARATQNRWPQALDAWRSVSPGGPFDAWLVQAGFAGFAVDSITAPMFAYAQRLVAAGKTPDFRRPPWDPLQEAFYALVHRAAIGGDSASVKSLLDRIASAPVDSQRAYPVEGMLQAALEGRLDLLARDTTAAIGALRRAVSRVHGPGDGFFPMVSMAPERLLLAGLLAATGDRSAAARWLDSFSETWAVGDAMFAPRVRTLRAHLNQLSQLRPAERPQ